MLEKIVTSHSIEGASKATKNLHFLFISLLFASHFISGLVNLSIMIKERNESDHNVELFGIFMELRQLFQITMESVAFLIILFMFWHYMKL